MAVDFDGTLYDRISRQPYPYAPEAMKWFRRWGYRITVFSGRAQTPASRAWMSGWMKENGIVFDDVTNEKPSQIAWFIDDRAVPFDPVRGSWHEITEAVKERTFPWKSPTQR